LSPAEPLASTHGLQTPVANRCYNACEVTDFNFRTLIAFVT